MRAVHCCFGDTYTRLSQRDCDTGGPACPIAQHDEQTEGEKR
jgi:hypothetical protein